MFINIGTLTKNVDNMMSNIHKTHHLNKPEINKTIDKISTILLEPELKHPPTRKNIEQLFDRLKHLREHDESDINDDIDPDCIAIKNLINQIKTEYLHPQNSPPYDSSPEAIAQRQKIKENEDAIVKQYPRTVLALEKLFNKIKNAELGRELKQLFEQDDWNLLESAKMSKLFLLEVIIHLKTTIYIEALIEAFPNVETIKAKASEFIEITPQQLGKFFIKPEGKIVPFLDETIKESRISYSDFGVLLSIAMRSCKPEILAIEKEAQTRDRLHQSFASLSASFSRPRPQK